MRGYDAKFLDLLKSKNPLIEVVSRYVPLEQRGNGYWGRCPFHHEKTASFCVNAADDYYYCFGCHKSGDAISFIMEMEAADFSEAVKILAERAKIDLPERSADDARLAAQKAEKERILSALKDAAKFYHDNLRSEKAGVYLDYLQKRGVDAKTLVRFGLGASLDFNGLPEYLHGKGHSYKTLTDAGIVGTKDGSRYFDALGKRLIIPVINQLGQVVAFCGRILEDKGFAKYVNTKDTPVFNKKDLLFNVNNLKKLKQEKGVDSVIIVEGHMDVISLVAAGFENVAASMGTALTKNQARLIKRYCPNVLISYDGDFAGQKASVRGLEILRDEGLDVKVAEMPDGFDPDDVIRKMGADAYRRILDDAKPLIDFKMNVLKKTFSLDNDDQKRKYIAQALKVIKESDSVPEREILLKELRDSTGVSYESLKREFDGIEQSVTAPDTPVTVETVAEKTVQAQRYVLYAVLFGKNFARDFDFSQISFNIPAHKVIAEYLAHERDEGREVKPNLLFDIVDDSLKDELSEIMAIELHEADFNKERYFKDCVKTLCAKKIDEDIAMLNKLFEQETDVVKRGVLAGRLNAKIKEKNLLNG